MLHDLTTSTSSSSPSLSESGFTLSAQAVSRSFVASLAFLLYDILLTLDEEVELIWRRRKWSLFKVLYFYVRYIPFILQLPLLLVGTEVTPLFHFTPKDCFIWQVYQGVVTIVVFAPVDYILVARIYALFHSSPLVQLFVSVSYVASVVIMVVGLAVAVPEVTFDEICHTTSVPRKVLINGGTEVAFQTLLFLITLYKFISILKAEGWNTVKAVPILQIVVKDGTWAFFLLFTLVGAQALVYVTSTEGGVLFGWVLCAFSFCGYRILLNLNHVPRSRRQRSHHLRQTRASRIHSPPNRHSIHANSRSRGTGSLSNLFSQITQWAEYISPVSFDDWGDYEHADRPSPTSQLVFESNRHSIFTNIHHVHDDGNEEGGTITEGDPEALVSLATNFSGGSHSYMGAMDGSGSMIGTGAGQEYELIEMSSPRNERLYTR